MTSEEEVWEGLSSFLGLSPKHPLSTHYMEGSPRGALIMLVNNKNNNKVIGLPREFWS